MIRKIATGYCLCIFSVSSLAQGAFDFDQVSGLNQEPIVVININSVAIGFARTFLSKTDPATAKLLEGLRGIKLRVYHGEEKARQINSYIRDVTEQLEDDGWQSIMSVHDEETNVQLHLRMSDSDVSGLTLMAFDGDEAVFLNIDGSVSAENLGAVMAAFNQGSVVNGLPFGMPGSAAVE